MVESSSTPSSPSSSSLTTADRVRIFVIVLLLLGIVLQNTVPSSSTKDNTDMNIFQQHASSASPSPAIAINDQTQRQDQQQRLSSVSTIIPSTREKNLINISQSELDKIPAFMNSPNIEFLLGEYDKVEIPEMTYNQYEIITEKKTTEHDDAVGKITFRKFIPLEAINFMRMESILKSLQNKKKEKNVTSSPQESELLVNREEASEKSKPNNEEISTSVSVASTFLSVFTRTNRTRSSPIIIADEDPFTGDVTTSYPPLVYDEVKTAQFLAMVSDTPPGLGLTTQLLTYIDLIAAVQNVHFRTLVFPGNIRTNWFTLINMSATSFPGPSLTFVSSNRTLAEVRKIQSQISSKKHVKWTREAAYLGPHALIHKIRKFYFKTRGIGIVKVPSMYKRYPFLVEPETNFGIMTCGLVFHSKIEEASLKLMDAMEQLVVKKQKQMSDSEKQQEQQRQVHFHPETTRPKFPWFVAPSSSPLPYFIPKIRYISVHLRIEAQDSVAFRRPAPTPQQVENWFRTVITNLCKKHRTPHVFVASGPIDQNYTNVLKQKNKYRIDFGKREVVWMNVFSKDDLFEFTGGNFSQMKFDYHENNNNNNGNYDYFNEEATPVIWERRTIYPTNTRAAAVDALILQHGVAAVLTAFSSLTPLIYSRRCYEGPRCLGKLYGKRGKYFVDDDHDEGKMTATKAKGMSNYIYEVGSEGDLTKAKPYRCGLQMGQIIQGGGAEHPGFENELYSEGVKKDREKLFE